MRVIELLVSEMAAVPAFSASINASPASIIDPDWWSTLGALLRANSGVAERLLVEITESMAIHNVDDTRGFVTRVKDLGCRIQIDDFGSGFTSFRNLRKLGVDVLKIDGAFVQHLTRSHDDRSFVHSLVDLARRSGSRPSPNGCRTKTAQTSSPNGALGGLCQDRASVGRHGAGRSPQDRAHVIVTVAGKPSNTAAFRLADGGCMNKA